MIRLIGIFSAATFIASLVNVQGGPVASGSHWNSGGETLPVLDSRWRLSAGYMHRNLGELKFQTGSRSQDMMVRSLVGNEFERSGRVGAPNGAGDRFYDNGFVRIDGSGSEDGLTWFWAYENSGQLRSSAGALRPVPGAAESIAFRNSMGQQRSVHRSQGYSPSSWQADVEGESPLLMLERQFPISGRLRGGIGMGFSFLEWDASQSSTTFTAVQSAVESRTVIEDTFGLGGIVPPLAPFSGTFEGPGPLLDVAPMTRRVSESEISNTRVSLFNRVDESLDVDLYTLSPGFSVEWQGERLFANLGAGMTINFAEWQATHQETLYASTNGGSTRELQSWQERAGDTEVLLGGYVQVGLGVELSERLSVQGFGRYDWTQELEGSVGPSDFSLGLDGASAGVMVSWSF